MRVRLPALIFFVIAAGGVAAQPYSQRLKLNDNDARKVMRDFAGCVVKSTPDLASRAVVEDWSSKQLTEPGDKLLDPNCLRAAGLIAAVRFQPSNALSAFAESLIARQPQLTVSKEQLVPVAPLAFRHPRPEPTVDEKGKPLKAKVITAQQQAYDQQLGVIAGQQVTECVIRAHPASVRAVFATQLGSGDEMAAFKALANDLPPCIPAGKQFSFDRKALRGVLAMSYYRLAMAARGVVWAGEPESAGGVGS